MKGGFQQIKFFKRNIATEKVLDYLNLDYDIFGLLYDIPASCCLSFLISFISSDT